MLKHYQHFLILIEGIVRHINNVYKDVELSENSICAKIAHVGDEEKGKISHDMVKDKA